MEILAPHREATMDLLESAANRLKFEVYVDELARVIGHADRIVPLHYYCTGLVLPGERKSVEPMAALTAPARTARNTNRCCISSPSPRGPMRPC
jgi:SRSO17 transposase